MKLIGHIVAGAPWSDNRFSILLTFRDSPPLTTLSLVQVWLILCIRDQLMDTSGREYRTRCLANKSRKTETDLSQPLTVTAQANYFVAVFPHVNIAIGIPYRDGSTFGRQHGECFDFGKSKASVSSTQGIGLERLTQS